MNNKNRMDRFILNRSTYLSNYNELVSKNYKKIDGFELLGNKALDFHWELVGNKYFQANLYFF